MRLAKSNKSRVGIRIPFELLLVKFVPGPGDSGVAKLVSCMHVAHVIASKA
jgi:hypothetical protein